jgi:hypothetical protein
MQGLTSGEHDALQVVVCRREVVDALLEYAHSVSCEAFARVVAQRGGPVRAEHDVTAPAEQLERELTTVSVVATVDSDGLIPPLPPVTVRTAVDARPIKLTHPGYRRQSIHHAGGQDQLSTARALAVCSDYLEASLRPARRVDHARTHDPEVGICAELIARDREQFSGWHPVAREEVVHAAGDRVARLAFVEHRHAPARASEYQGRTEPRGASAHDDHVERSVLHAQRVCTYRASATAQSGKV